MTDDTSDTCSKIFAIQSSGYIPNFKKLCSAGAMKGVLLTIALSCALHAVLAAEVRLVDLDPPEAQQQIEKQDQSLHYAPKVDTNVPAIRYLGNEPHNVLEDIYLARQYHGQDGLGGYLYGYNIPDIAKTEKKIAGGDLRGAYNYISEDGQEIKVQYWDDGTGFHQIDNVPKILPKQIDDSPEVKAEKEKFLARWREEAERNKHPIASPYDSEGNYASGPLSLEGQAEFKKQFANQYPGPYQQTSSSGIYQQNGQYQPTAQYPQPVHSYQASQYQYQQPQQDKNKQNNQYYGQQGNQLDYTGQYSENQNNYANPNHYISGPSKTYPSSHDPVTSSSNQYPGAYTPTASTSNQYTGSHTPTASASNQYTGSYTPTASASNQYTGSYTPTASTSNQYTGSYTPTASTSNQYTGSHTPTASASNQYTGSYTPTASVSASNQYSLQSQPSSSVQYQTDGNNRGLQSNTNQYNQQHETGQYQGGQYQHPGQYENGQYQQTGQYRSSSNIEYSGKYDQKWDEEDTTGPPKGFFYSFDYPVGKIVQKGAKIGELKNVYDENRAKYENQLSTGQAASSSAQSSYAYSG